MTLDGYADLVRAAGFEVVSADALPRSAWENYYEPIRVNLAAIRAEHPNEPMGQIDDELRIWDSGLGPDWWRYGVFVARASSSRWPMGFVVESTLRCFMRRGSRSVLS